MTEKSGEVSEPPVSGNTISDTSVVDEAIRAELTKSLRNLGINPGLHGSTSKSESVID